MLMDNDSRLQILVNYLDGSGQIWGYDGKWFADFDAVFADVARDFPTDFFEQYKNVVSMRLGWNNGEQVKNLPSPICGEELIQAVSGWLVELGVIENGN